MGNQLFLPLLPGQSVVTPSRVTARSPDCPFFMPHILLLADGQDAGELPGLKREQPSPVPLDAAYDLWWQVFSNFIKANNSPVSCCDWGGASGGTSQSPYCRPATACSLSKASRQPAIIGSGCKGGRTAAKDRMFPDSMALCFLLVSRLQLPL